LSGGSSSPRGATELQRRIERQIAELSQAPTTLSAAHTFLSRLTTAAAELAAAVGSDGDLTWWAEAYERSCQDHLSDLLHLAPWLSVSAPPEHVWTAGSAKQTQRLDE